MPRKRAKSPQQEMRVMLGLSPGVFQCFFAGIKQPSLGEREPRFRAVGRTGPLLLFLLVWGLAAIPLREIGDNLLVGRWQGAGGARLCVWGWVRDEEWTLHWDCTRTCEGTTTGDPWGSHVG